MAKHLDFLITCQGSFIWVLFAFSCLPIYNTPVGKSRLVCVVTILFLGILSYMILWGSDVATVWKHILSFVLAVADLLLIVFVCAK